MDVDHSAQHGLDAAAEFVEQVLAEAGVDRGRVIGVGMGLPAPIDRATGAVQAASILPGWVGVDAARRGERTASACRSRSRTTPTSARSPSSSWGAARGKSEVAYIKVSTGIGAGLISGGRLQHGVGGTAGEIGHTLVAEGGPVCRCGNRGCLETLASSRAIADLLSASRREPISTRRMLELCSEGDAAAQRLVGDAGRAIGDGGREPLQPRQSRVRDRRRRSQRRRRVAARAAARGRAAATRSRARSRTSRSSPACSANAPRCSAPWRSSCTSPSASPARPAERGGMNFERKTSATQAERERGKERGDYATRKPKHRRTKR